MDEGKKRMTAKRKLEVYLETRQKDANVGEILQWEEMGTDLFS